MPRTVYFKGSPLTLAGRVLKTGMFAPEFKVSGQDLSEVKLSGFNNKIKILTFFLSLDTSVCDRQVREFNKMALSVSKDVSVLAISKDLPFAQRRFCQSNDIKDIHVLSDYRTSSFGINYGLLIKETNLLARGVIILDKNNCIRYIQIVNELTNPPDYAAAIENLEKVIKEPNFPVREELPSRCKPCEGSIASLPKETVDRLIAQYRGWELSDSKKLVKEFKFSDFQDAKYFLELISVIADEQGHHPVLTLIYNKLRVTLTTHAAGGLTENDFIMAKIIDELEV